MRTPFLLASGLICTALSSNLAAQTESATDPKKPTAEEAVAELAPFEVIGSKQAAQALPGSGAYLSAEDIRAQNLDDINRVLRQIPGVYIREEDGYGLFPNISLRAVDPGRTSKVTVMEDGVPTAPAPYAAPAAYYTPTTGRMAGIEVLKGSSQIRFGPHTTGGVINYISTPIPTEQSGRARVTYGDDNELRVHSWFGTTESTAYGDIGWLVEAYYRETDGFKELDGPVSDVGPDAQNTGFRKTDPMIKLAWSPNTSLPQTFQLRFGTSDLDANETYLGLSESDFAANPNRRYAATRFDNITTAQDRLDLRHTIQLSDRTELATVAYQNTFHRNWFKIRSVNGESLGTALAGSNGGTDLATLRGEAAGTLGYRNNNREYKLTGLQTELTSRINKSNTLRVGARLHEDQIFRFQNNVTFNQNADGSIASREDDAPGSQANRIQKARALSVWAEHAFRVGALTLTPGVRVESIDYTFEDFRNTDPARQADETLIAGGLGANFVLNEQWTLFGGVYRGISPASPSSATSNSNPREAETSLSGELGARFEGGPADLAAEVALFSTRFDNLLVDDNIGASGTDNGGAVGEVDSYGIELLLRADPGAAWGWALGTPSYFSATYTSAEIGNDSNSTDAESIFSGGEPGNELPYIPGLQFSFGTGLQAAAWSVALTGSYVAETFTSASNVRSTTAPDGTPDSRFGTTDSYFVMDLSGEITLSPTLSLIAGAHNLLDREYIVSRVPEGPRPGKPRSAYLGFDLSF